MMKKKINRNFDLVFVIVGGGIVLFLLLPNCMNLVIWGIESLVIHRESVDRAHLAEFIRCMYVSIYLPIACFLLTKRINKICFFYPIYAIFSFVFTNVEIWKSNSFDGIHTMCDFWDFSSIFQYGSVPAYPPFANVFVHWGNVLVSKNKEYASNYLLLLMFLVSLYILFGCVSYYYAHNKPETEFALNNIFVFSLLISNPMIFAYERMNIIILAFAFTVMFLIFDSLSDIFSRIISVVSLVFAANLKYYPAVYGLILLKKKKWKTALVSFGGGVFCYLCSAIWISHSSVIGKTGKSTINNMGDMFRITIEWVNSGLGKAGICIKEIVYFVFKFLKINAPSFPFYFVYLVTTVLFLCVSVWTFFQAKRKDFELTMLAMLCILTPPVSYNYSLLFLLIPFAVFLKERGDSFATLDIVQLFLFADILVVSFKNYPLLLRGHIHVPILMLWGLTVFRVWSERRKKSV